MKVLQINTVYPNGSTGRITAAIAEYTAKQPDSYALVAFGIGEETQTKNIAAHRFGSPLQRKLHGAIRKLFDMEGYGSHGDTRRLIRLCKQEQVDVVHLHNLHGCYINLRVLFRFLKEEKLPVIWTMHDCWPITGHCVHFSYCGCDKWKALCKKCPQKNNYPQCIGISGSSRNYRLKRKLFKSLPQLTMVAPCRWMQNIVQESFLKEMPSRVIYNGVDTRIFKPTASDLKERYGLENKKLLLAVASDWTERKGLHILEKLAGMLDESYQLIIIGLTQQQMRTLPVGIYGMERLTTTEDLCAWYTAADCFVNPTLEDTMPLVNLEAMACGTPLVVFNTGGCAEAVSKDCGIVVEQGNIHALIDAARCICESPTDYANACRMQAERFAMEITLQAYHSLYQEVMQ